MIEMQDESEMESLARLAGMGGRRSLQANTANMIQNRSSLSSDDEWDCLGTAGESLMVDKIAGSEPGIFLFVRLA